MSIKTLRLNQAKVFFLTKLNFLMFVRYVALLCENKDVQIPVPSFNLISGGRASGNDLIYQEFLIMPTGNFIFIKLIKDNLFQYSKRFKNNTFKKNVQGAKNFAEAMKIGTEIYRKLESQLAEEGETPLPLPVSDDGTLSSDFEDDADALTKINEAVTATGNEGKVKIALDMAATAMFKDG